MMNANEIRRLRRQLGITQEELANHIGTAQQVVSAWENGTQPRRMATRLLTDLAREHNFTFIDEPEPVYSTE